MRSTSQLPVWIAGVVLSLAMHGGSFTLLSEAGRKAEKEKRQPIKVRVVEKKPEVKVEEPKKEEPPPPPPPPPPPKPKPKKEPVATNKPPPQTPQKPVEAIQGFDKDKMAPSSGPGIAVPIGNTVMAKDTGKRVQEAPPITGDQSQDARLIANSYAEPRYTDAAIDAGLEGRYTVDVFVDEKGNVAQAELRKKIGYGMDQKIIDAVMTAKFMPRKNKLGIVESGWTNIAITLRLP